MELSIDTSTRYASVCLSREGEVLAEHSWHSQQNHSVELLPAVEQLLKMTNTYIQDVECIVIAIGPGGFSALRVGLSTAKGLAMSLGVPLVALNTLDVEAHPYCGLGLSICAVLDMGRGEMAAATYYGEGVELDRLTDERLVTPEELCDSIHEPTLFCGEGVSLFGASIKERLGENAVIAQQTLPTRRPGTLAQMGFQRFQRGENDNIYTLEPLYLRRPSITAPKQFS